MPKNKGYSKEPWYGSYRGMMARCENPKTHNYDKYGGRGIKVCEEWHDIDAFAEWVNKSNYEKGLTLDRIDVDGNYEPSNCRWATRKQQANNRRNSLMVTIDGVTKTLSEWADFAGIPFKTINSRYHDKGIRGVMLLHRVEDTKFKNGYNRYANPKHYDDYVIEAEVK